MKAVEFITIPANGCIQLPEKLKKMEFNKKIKVIILFEDKKKCASGNNKKDFLSGLIEAPLKIKKFKPLTRKEIYE